MTKDNWIKAFEKLWETDEDNGGWYSPGNGGERHFYKVQDFISQVEKDAIEKTKQEIYSSDKNWRQSLAMAREKGYLEGVEKTSKRWLKKLGIKDGHSYKVWRDGDSVYFADEDNFKIKSDLLEDK